MGIPPGQTDGQGELRIARHDDGRIEASKHHIRQQVRREVNLGAALLEPHPQPGRQNVPTEAPLDQVEIGDRP
jgi:hypothetical protein